MSDGARPRRSRHVRHDGGALLLEREPRLNATSVTDLIIRGADDVGPVGRDDDFGAGRANAYRSIKLLLGNGLAQKQDPGVKTAE